MPAPRARRGVALDGAGLGIRPERSPAEAQLQADLVRAYIAGYDQAVREAYELLHAPPRSPWRPSWRFRRTWLAQALGQGQLR